MPPAESILAAFPSTALRHFAATRPAFLFVTCVTCVGCLLGLAAPAQGDAPVDPMLATLTLFFALA